MGCFTPSAWGEQVQRVSSPRLHHGRAANYGSIIIPGRIIALYGCHPYISAHGIACSAIG